jgi:hypothetical protein
MEGNWYGPAFPVPGNYPAGMNEMPVDDMRDAANTINKPQKGMSLRLWVAMKFIPQLLSALQIPKEGQLDLSVPLTRAFHLADLIIEASNSVPNALRCGGGKVDHDPE